MYMFSQCLLQRITLRFSASARFFIFFKEAVPNDWRCVYSKLKCLNICCWPLVSLVCNKVTWVLISLRSRFLCACGCLHISTYREGFFCQVLQPLTIVAIYSLTGGSFICFASGFAWNNWKICGEFCVLNHVLETVNTLLSCPIFK